MYVCKYGDFTSTKVGEIGHLRIQNTYIYAN